MSATADRPVADGARAVPLAVRLFGLGSVFGKTVRDSRLAFVVVAASIALVMIAGASQIAAEYGNPILRAGLAAQMTSLPPLIRGLLGDPVGIETLPGFLSWRVMGFMPLIYGLWSVTALSGTLAGEAARGSLELVVASPVSRARIGAEKAAAHVVVLVAAMAVGAIATWLSTVAFATVPGDQASLGAVAAHFSVAAGATLLAGAMAFALGPIVGRAGAAGIGGVLLIGSYVVNSYSSLVPIFASIKGLSFFAWISSHRPMGGTWDWPMVGLVWAVAAALLVAGVIAFARRDLGDFITGHGTRRSLLPVGVEGPFARSFADRLPAGILWGLGLGAYTLVIAASAREFAAALQEIPAMLEIVERFFPGIDVTTAGGILQLAFFELGTLIAGLAAVTFVAGWASDETERRLEVILAAPIARLHWALRSGAGLFGGVAAMTLIVAAAAALGVASQGDDIGPPVLGIGVLGLYSAGLVGGGLLLSGLLGPRRAVAILAAYAIGSYVLFFLGGLLNLPDAILAVALLDHLGQPMVGQVDAVGVGICAILAVGGLLGGAAALARRDIGN